MKLKFRAWNENYKQMKKVFGLDLENKKAFLCKELNTWWEMKHCKLMQYTDLKDKNDKEIYGDDVLEKQSHWKVRVEFENGVFWVRDLNLVRYTNRIINIPIANFPVSEWEVIGNICENKDLLEG